MNAQTATLLGIGCTECGGECQQGLGVIDTPTSDWQCFKWVDWHKSLVKSYKDMGYSDEDSQKYAKSIFLTWWDKINTFWSSLNWCGYESEFYTYFKSVGITEHLSFLARVSAPIISATADVANSAGTILKKTGEVGEHAAGAAGTTSKILQILIPVALVAAAGGGAYYVYKHYLKGNEKVKIPKRPALGGVKNKRSRIVIHI